VYDFTQISIVGVIKIATPIVAWAGYAVRRRYRNSQAVGWQPTDGTVHDVKSEYKDGLWTSTVSYSYSWEGEYYAGFHMKPFAKESSADEFATKFPRGSKVTVRVNVDNPETSVLLDKDQFAMN
jgi:hypothetical protein